MTWLGQLMIPGYFIFMVLHPSVSSDSFSDGCGNLARRLSYDTYDSGRGLAKVEPHSSIIYFLVTLTFSAHSS